MIVTYLITRNNVVLQHKIVFYDFFNISLALNKKDLNITYFDGCPFHQHFMYAFFVRMCFVQHNSSILLTGSHCSELRYVRIKICDPKI